MCDFNDTKSNTFLKKSSTYYQFFLYPNIGLLLVLHNDSNVWFCRNQRKNEKLMFEQVIALHNFSEDSEERIHWQWSLQFYFPVESIHLCAHYNINLFPVNIQSFPQV